jgi:UDP-2,3-diacylglucosamine hydrolase
MSEKKTFFASDFHLGHDARLTSKERERAIVQWLHQNAPDAAAIYLVGDLFEFWYEYKHVVPRGYTRLLGTLAELSDTGLPIHVFCGNHDVWLFDYFPQELGIPVYRQPIQVQIQGKQFLIGHGDGLGPGDTGYKLLKKVFTNPTCQWAFRQLHPDLGASIAHFASGKSRAATSPAERDWLGDEQEWLLQYCLRKLAQGIEPDYFVFGHRHLPIDYLLPNQRSRYINLGEWFWATSYGVFDGSSFELRFFDERGKGKIIRNAP